MLRPGYPISKARLHQLPRARRLPQRPCSPLPHPQKSRLHRRGSWVASSAGRGNDGAAQATAAPANPHAAVLRQWEQAKSTLEATQQAQTALLKTVFVSDVAASASCV